MSKKITKSSKSTNANKSFTTRVGNTLRNAAHAALPIAKKAVPYVGAVAGGALIGAIVGRK